MTVRRLVGTLLFVLLLGTAPQHTLAQTGTTTSTVIEPTPPPVTLPPPPLEALQVELIPANNTNVFELPATFYCRVTDTTGSFLEIFPQWFINGVPAELTEGPFEVVLPPAAPNNLTVISSFEPLSVSCRTSFYPNIDLGVFQISIPDVIIEFDQLAVNASEGNSAVVCASAQFNNEFPFDAVFSTNLSAMAGTADPSDYGSLPQLNFIFPFVSRQCVRIPIINDTITEGEEYFTLQLSVAPGDFAGFTFVPERGSMTRVNIREMCFDGEIRLRDGFDENQGRVEVCFGGVWGTVCGDGWQSNAGLNNAPVVCRQLGLFTSDTRILTMALGFGNAIFGPASYSQPIILDDVLCVGNETQLLDCPRSDIGVHNCQHLQDASVDCLGRSPVGKPCSRVGDSRLVGGLDIFQGHVEVCTEALIYSTVCSLGWDNLDAQVVCRQQGVDNAAVTLAFNGEFGRGVGTVQLANVACIGNETSLLNCTNQGAAVCSSHTSDVGVDCLGRPLPPPPTIGYDTSTGRDFFLREGESIQLCVVLLSGSIPFRFTFEVDISRSFEQPRDSPEDFNISSPIAAGSFFVELFLGPSVSRSCFTINTIDDAVPEVPSKTYQFFLPTFFEGPSTFQVSSTSNIRTVTILDDDFNCAVGESRCFEAQSARCIESSSVCNGFADCSDGSDESNCTDYCSGMTGFNCLSERRCVPQDYVCDGVPDCVLFDTSLEELNCDDCINDMVRQSLIGGLSTNEGLVEVCVDGTYLPVSLDNGRFSIAEATVICRELGIGNAGIPLTSTDTVSIRQFELAQIVCDGSEASVSGCAISKIPTVSSAQAQVRCFQQIEPPCQDGAIRLSPDGPSPNEGRVEICYDNVWGAVHDQQWNEYDAAVACAQLGFDRNGAIPIVGVTYGSTDTLSIAYSNPFCVGTEASLTDCPVISSIVEGPGGPVSGSIVTTAVGETGIYQNSASVPGSLVGVRCENRPRSCTYLDTRLTFRSTDSTGILEVCDELGQWSRVCADGSILISDAFVACNQLGFDPSFPPNIDIVPLTTNPALSDGGQPVSFRFVENSLGCLGTEQNLTSCPGVSMPTEPPPIPLRRRRQAGEPLPLTCGSLVRIGCSAPPMVTFDPPSIGGSYEVELGRQFSLSCMFNRNIYPTPILFEGSRASAERVRRGAAPVGSNFLNIISSGPIGLSDADVYYCQGLYGAQSNFREGAQVTVRGPGGMNETAYIRFSIATAIRLDVSSSVELANFLGALVLVFIPEELPGLQVIDYCVPVNSTEMDIGRGLERIECRVTQYSNSGESVMPVEQVLERVSVDLPRAFKVFKNPADVSVTGFCDAEETVSDSGTTFVWPETLGGDTAFFICPLSPSFNATRPCNFGGEWQLFDEMACGVVLGILNTLNNSFSNLTVETYVASVAMLSQVIEDTENAEVEQNSGVLGSVANYFGELAVFVNTSNITINVTVIDDVVGVVSSLLQWQASNVQVASSSSVVESFEVVVSIYAQQLSLNENQTFVMPSITLVAELRSVETLSQTGRSFAIGGNELELADGGQVMAGQLTPQQTAAINLPASLFAIINDRPNVGVFFALYDTSVLFPVNSGRDREAIRRAEVVTDILAATVGPGIVFENLEEDVTIVLRVQPPVNMSMAPGTERCVSWDFITQDWTPNGCTTIVGEDGIVTCSCNHLTNFAVLVDVCLRQENCEPSNTGFETALTFISYIGMSISLVSLVITIITLLLFKKLRQKDTSKYHLQLSLAILFMLIVSFVLVALSAESVASLYGGCVTVSILVHYFTLVAVMWMAAEALLMFQKLVIVFVRITTKFIVGISILCWTAPIILVLIPLIVDLATGHAVADDIVVRRGVEISFCFLSHPGAFWGAFLAPIIAVLIFNTVIFIWVIVVLVRHTRGTAARMKESVSTKTIIRLMISISGVMFLFGITWLFAILTFSVTGLRETFQILFVIFNSFQGFFIFLFFCVLNKEALESWREFLSCGRYRSKMLHPSQAGKYSSSTGTKKPKQTKTYSTGFGSSSAGGKNAIASEVSKSDYDSTTFLKQKDFESEADMQETTPLKKVDLGTPEPAIVLVDMTNRNENQNGNTESVEASNEGKGEEEEEAAAAASLGQKKKKKSKGLSLRARIKRYSTKKISKHHVEEVEVDFHSDDSSSGSSGEEETTDRV